MPPRPGCRRRLETDPLSVSSHEARALGAIGKAHVRDAHAVLAAVGAPAADDHAPPDLLWAELGNALWKKHRRRELDPRTARRLLRDFARVPIEYHASERWTEGALELAIRHGITVHDGLYLALAAGNGCRVVTADRRLHETCQGGALGQVVSWVRDIR